MLHLTCKAYDWHINDTSNGILIKIYALTTDNKTVCIRVEDYKPYVFLQLPIFDSNMDKIVWDDNNVKRVYSYVCDLLPTHKPLGYRFHYFKKLYFYQKDAKYPMMLLRFKNQKEAIRQLESATHKLWNITGLTSESDENSMQLQFFAHMGTNIDVGIKFVREKKIGFSGWLNIAMAEENRKKVERQRISRCDYEYICFTADINDASKLNLPIPNPIVHSFDIETYSHCHRKFPDKTEKKDEIISITSLTMRSEDQFKDAIVDIITRKPSTPFTHYLCVKEEQGEVNDIDDFHRRVLKYKELYKEWSTDGCKDKSLINDKILSFFQHFTSIRDDTSEDLRSLFDEIGEGDDEKKQELYTAFVALMKKRKDYDKFLIPASNVNVWVMQDELQVLLKWGEILLLRNPQVITGYNVVGYDLETIHLRTTKVHKHLKDDIGPVGMLLGGKPYFKNDSWSSNAFKNQVFKLYQFEGRITLDMLKIVQRDHKLRSYKLGYVSEMFVEDSKVEMEYENLFKLWERGSKEDVHQILDYNIYDCVLPMKLFKKMNVWIGCNEFSNIFGISIMNIFERGQQIRTLSQIVDKCLRDDRVLDQNMECRVCQKWYYHGYYAPENALIHSKTSKKAKPRSGCCSESCYHRWDGVWFEDLSDEELEELGYSFENEEEKTDFWENQVVYQSKYKGAFVVPPKLGLHNNVNTFDFKSLYPSIIIAFNICWTTFIHFTESDSVPDEECNIITDESTGSVYKFKKSPVGLLPQICNELLSERKKTRSGQKAFVSNSVDWLILEMRQLALKLSANSAYGGMGTLSGKTGFRAGAVSVTASGRRLIHQAIDYGKIHHNLNLIYGDTDSCMFNIPGLIGKDVVPYVSKMVEDVNTQFPSPVMFEYEKYLFAIFNMAKKCYNYMWMKLDGSPVIEYTKDDGSFLVLPGCESSIKGKRIDFVNTVNTKGTVGVRREATYFLQETFFQVAYRICMGMTKEEAVDLVHAVILYLFQFRYPLHKLTKTNEIGSNYAADNPQASSKRKQTIPPHVQLARSLSLKGDVRQPGERIDYIFVTHPSPKAELVDQVQEPNWWRKNECFPPIDFCLYVEKQFLEPISKMLDIAYPEGVSSGKSFHKYIEGIIKYHRLYRIVRQHLIEIFHHLVEDGDGVKFIKFKIVIECKLRPPYIPENKWDKKRCKKIRKQ
jgi:DNA polymerase elongation subunit (family B)